MAEERDAFVTAMGVSRETLARFDLYEALVRRWQPAVNLVARSTIDALWSRHFLDSAQLLHHCPESTRTLVDLGSGAGFPGLVLAILGIEDVHLIESDQRKAAFLREAARQIGVPITVHAKRIEDIQGFAADAVTSRALAPLPDLIRLAHPFVGPTGTCLFLKGARVAEELTAASRLWHISSVETIRSVSDSQGSVLRLRGILPAMQPV